MRKFIIPPDKAGYSISDPNSVVSTQVASGANRYRRDMFGARSTVTVQWTCDPGEYQYVKMFFRAILNEGSLPFLIDMVLDHAPELTEHEAYFVPGSLKLSSHMGWTYVVSAQLDVKPKEITQGDIDYVAVFESFGPYFPMFEDLLNTIINVSLPEALENV